MGAYTRVGKLMSSDGYLKLATNVQKFPHRCNHSGFGKFHNAFYQIEAT